MSKSKGHLVSEPHKKKSKKQVKKYLSREIDWDYLSDFLQMRTPSSGESIGHNCIVSYITQLGYEIHKDTFGSLIVYAGEQIDDRLTIMVDTHLDEIGYVIYDADENGFIKFHPMHGVDEQVTPGIFVWIHTKNGMVKGLVGNKSVHLKNRHESEKTMVWDDMFIDIGAKNKKEALELVSVGDLVTASEEAHWLNKTRLASRALDNHISCFMAIQILKLLKDKKIKLDYNLIFTFTVQEETGIFGGRHMANKIKPDLAIIIDLDLSTDYPGIKNSQNVQIGEGVVISTGGITYNPLSEFIAGLAKKNNIKSQMVVSHSGGTNYTAMFVNGIPGIHIGVCGRYLHSSITTIDIFDVQDCIYLTIETLTNLKKMEGHIKPYLQPAVPEKKVGCKLKKKTPTVEEGIASLLSSK